MTQRCKARTRSRKQCRNRPLAGTTRCRAHSPADQTTPEEPKGPNEAALDRSLRALGREEDTDAARYQMLRSLACAVDAAPTRAALWAEYREALSELMKDAGDADGGLEEAVEALRSAAEMGDPANR